MPRKLRIELEGAIYHVLNRGDRREPIFHDDSDRKRLFQTLAEARAKTDWQVHALCGEQLPGVSEATDAALAGRCDCPRTAWRDGGGTLEATS